MAVLFMLIALWLIPLNWIAAYQRMVGAGLKRLGWVRGGKRASEPDRDRPTLDQRDGPAEGGGLVRQAHQELQRLTANALSLKQQISACDQQIAQIGAHAQQCTRDIREALASGDSRTAKRLVGDADMFEARSKAVHEDRAQLHTLLATAQAELVEHEATLEDGLRRAAIAQARLSTARNSIRARQLADGRLKEAALAQIERTEREADLAEAAASVLTARTDDTIERQFAELRQQVALERLAATQPAAARRSTAA